MLYIPHISSFPFPADFLSHLPVLPPLLWIMFLFLLWSIPVHLHTGTIVYLTDSHSLLCCPLPPSPDVRSRLPVQSAGWFCPALHNLHHRMWALAGHHNSHMDEIPMYMEFFHRYHWLMHIAFHILWFLLPALFLSGLPLPGFHNPPEVCPDHLCVLSVGESCLLSLSYFFLQVHMPSHPQTAHPPTALPLLPWSDAVLLSPPVCFLPVP